MHNENEDCDVNLGLINVYFGKYEACYFYTYEIFMWSYVFFFVWKTSTQRENSSILLLTNAMKKDEGEVYCLAENAAGSAEANFTLEILPQPTLQNILDTTQILVIILAIVAVLLVSLAVGIFLFLRQRRNRSAKPPEILATSTPVKPPRLNYEINPGSLVANGFKTKGDSTTDNPDLILETNTNGTYQVSQRLNKTLHTLLHNPGIEKGTKNRYCPFVPCDAW